MNEPKLITLAHSDDETRRIFASADTHPNGYNEALDEYEAALLVRIAGDE